MQFRNFIRLKTSQAAQQFSNRDHCDQLCAPHCLEPRPGLTRILSHHRRPALLALLWALLLSCQILRAESDTAPSMMLGTLTVTGENLNEDT
ncbi:MAG: hypothetical protein HN453_00680, partial [Gammaproteobacteria bacterium]|nr:hypothetical protein [Gammaproteobacteria bacterium]